jgi:hypothetical protein
MPGPEDYVQEQMRDHRDEGAQHDEDEKLRQ